MNGPETLATPRLTLRPLAPDDAPFTLELLNDPGYLRFIADRGVRTLEQARRYLEDGPLAMYARHGLGLLLAVRKSDGVPIGLCGLLRRDELPDVDLGFAFLPAARGLGFAREAAEALLDWGERRLALRRVIAIVQPDNAASLALLGRLGFAREGSIELRGERLELLARSLG